MRLFGFEQRGLCIKRAPGPCFQASPGNSAGPYCIASSSPSPGVSPPRVRVARTLALGHCLTLVLLAVLSPIYVSPVAATEFQSAEPLSLLLPDMRGYGLVPEGPAQIYTDNLFEHLNGGSGTYYDYGFQKLLVQYYKSPSAELTVEIYDMGSPLQAFGIYSSERSPQYKFIQVGAQGFKDEGILNFIADRFYIKLSAYGQNADQILDIAARAIEQKIQGSRNLPAELNQLPQTSRVPNSERFHPQNPLGLAAMGPAFSALYRSGSSELTCFFWFSDHESSATEKLRVLRDYFESTARVTNLANLGPFAGQVVSEKHGRVMFFSSGPLTVMCRNVPEGSAELLASFGREIVSTREHSGSQGG